MSFQLLNLWFQSITEKPCGLIMFYFTDMVSTAIYNLQCQSMQLTQISKCVKIEFKEIYNSKQYMYAYWGLYSGFNVILL